PARVRPPRPRARPRPDRARRGRGPGPRAGRRRLPRGARRLVPRRPGRALGRHLRARPPRHPPALRRLAADAGLRLLRAGTAFGDQFRWADAVRADDPRAAGLPAADPGDGARVEAIVAAARRFGEQARLLLEAAAELVAEAAARGPVVLWGAGSKGVTFLTTVEGTDRIRAAVDINPHRRGRHVPVSGHPVVAPADLVADPPATAIVLNPVYVDEIGAQLAELGLP